MAGHRSLLLFLLFLSVSTVSVFAQGPTGSDSQTALPNTATKSDSQLQPLVTPGQVVAQSIIDAQNGNSVPPLIFLLPPPRPTFPERANLFFSKSARGTSQFWDEFMKGVSDNKLGAATTLFSGAMGVYSGLTFNPAEVSFSSELLGTAPDLLSGAFMDSSLASTVSDISGYESVIFATAARGGSKVWPTAYGFLSFAQGVNEIAEQGVSSTQPQVLPLEPIPDTVLNPVEPSDDQILARVNQVQQQMADLNAQRQQLNQESVDLSNQITGAQRKAAALQEQDGQGYRASVDEAHQVIARAVDNFSPLSGANALLDSPDDGWALLENMFRQLAFLSAPRQTFDPCKGLHKNTIVYNVGCTNVAPPTNVCGPGYAVNPGALAAAQAPWNAYGNQLAPWRDPKYGPLDNSGRVAWCVRQ